MVLGLRIQFLFETGEVVRREQGKKDEFTRDIFLPEGLDEKMDSVRCRFPDGTVEERCTYVLHGASFSRAGLRAGGVRVSVSVRDEVY